jgi:hypothetical protein
MKTYRPGWYFQQVKVMNEKAAQHSVHSIPGKERRGYRGGIRRVFR